MLIAAYDIFSGFFDKDPFWLESAVDLSAASERMKSIAETKPGPYFIFCSHSRSVVDSVDTSAQNTAARKVAF